MRYHCGECADIPDADLASVGPVRVSTEHLHLVPATRPDSEQARVIPPQESRARRRFMQTYRW